MTQKKKTPDEKILQKLYELALASGDPFQEIALKTISSALGQSETATKTIARSLAQANLVKKGEEGKIFLTERGYQFVIQELLYRS